MNALFYLWAFGAVAILSLLVPQAMLEVLGNIDAVLRAFGSRTAAEIGSEPQMFTHILRQNSIAVLVMLVLGFLLQAQLAMLFAGGFYALICFLAPLTIGHSFAINDWLLIAAETTALLLAASLSSALAGENFGVAPTVRAWWHYSVQSWRTFSV